MAVRQRKAASDSNGSFVEVWGYICFAVYCYWINRFPVWFLGYEVGGEEGRGCVTCAVG
jgi:hypothetical protein